VSGHNQSWSDFRKDQAKTLPKLTGLETGRGRYLEDVQRVQVAETIQNESEDEVLEKVGDDTQMNRLEEVTSEIQRRVENDIPLRDRIQARDKQGNLVPAYRVGKEFRVPDESGSIGTRITTTDTDTDPGQGPAPIARVGAVTERIAGSGRAIVVAIGALLAAIGIAAWRT
jgi:hypothetical protein